MALQNGRSTECIYTIGCFAGCIMDKLSLWPLHFIATCTLAADKNSSKTGGKP